MSTKFGLKRIYFTTAAARAGFAGIMRPQGAVVRDTATGVSMRVRASQSSRRVDFQETSNEAEYEIDPGTIHVRFRTARGPAVFSSASAANSAQSEEYDTFDPRASSSSRSRTAARAMVPDEAVEAVEADRREEVEAVEADRREEVEAVEADRREEVEAVEADRREEVEAVEEAESEEAEAAEAVESDASVEARVAPEAVESDASVEARVAPEAVESDASVEARVAPEAVEAVEAVEAAESVESDESDEADEADEAAEAAESVEAPDEAGPVEAHDAATSHRTSTDAEAPEPEAPEPEAPEATTMRRPSTEPEPVAIAEEEQEQIEIERVIGRLEERLHALMRVVCKRDAYERLLVSLAKCDTRPGVVDVMYRALYDLTSTRNGARAYRELTRLRTQCASCVPPL